MAACGTHLTEGKFCLAHRLFFNNWIELPTTFTQTSVSWALLGKNGKVWQYWTAFLRSNVQQDLRSNVRPVMWSPVPSNIILSPRPSSLHFLLTAWPSGHLRMCLCWRFLYPLGSQKKTLQRRWLFNRTLKYGCAEILCSFTAQRETSTNFTCIFSYRPLSPFLVSRTAQGFCHLYFGIKTARVPIQSLSFTWWMNLETWTGYPTFQIVLLQNGEDSRVYLVVLLLWGISKRSHMKLAASSLIVTFINTISDLGSGKPFL